MNFPPARKFEFSKFRRRSVRVKSKFSFGQINILEWILSGRAPFLASSNSGFGMQINCLDEQFVPWYVCA